MVSERSLANLSEPFGAGNGAAIRHGAQVAAWRLRPRTLEIADALRGLVPGFSESDEVTLRLLALTLCRLELAEEWLGEQGSLFVPGRKGDVWPVLKLMQSWESAAAKLCASLGLSPAARARIGSEAASGRVSAALEEHLRDTYGAGE